MYYICIIMHYIYYIYYICICIICNVLHIYYIYIYIMIGSVSFVLQQDISISRIDSLRGSLNELKSTRVNKQYICEPRQS